MHAARRIAEPAAGRVGAVLVLEDAIQHDNLLAAGVAMGLKHRARRPAHQRLPLPLRLSLPLRSLLRPRLRLLRP